MLCKRPKRRANRSSRLACVTGAGGHAQAAHWWWVTGAISAAVPKFRAAASTWGDLLLPRPLHGQANEGAARLQPGIWDRGEMARSHQWFADACSCNSEYFPDKWNCYWCACFTGIIWKQERIQVMRNYFKANATRLVMISFPAIHPQGQCNGSPGRATPQVPAVLLALT